MRLTYAIWISVVGALAMAGCGGRSALSDPLLVDDAGVPADLPADLAPDLPADLPPDLPPPCRAQPPGPLALLATVRDFNDTHPDFENVIADDRGIVEAQLGADGLPVYAGHPTTPTTHGKALFDQWYRDVPGVNLSTPLLLMLNPVGDGPEYRVDNDAFFPIDNQLFGNQGRDHNFHFTLELHTKFRYRGGEVFSFSGDDDLWVFINGRLAIDLGGVHGREDGRVDLDARAGELGLQPGEVANLDLFFAERHTTDSAFHLETTITEFVECP
jgi:fibro-slime domain-containing protein